VLATGAAAALRTVLYHRRPGVIAELHAFLTAEGVHPATAVDWFTDSLGFAAYHPEPVNDSAAELGSAAAKSADAAVADVGGQRRVQDLGRLEAERLDPVEDALPRTEQDRSDVEGELVDHPS